MEVMDFSGTVLMIYHFAIFINPWHIGKVSAPPLHHCPKLWYRILDVLDWTHVDDICFLVTSVAETRKIRCLYIDRLVHNCHAALSFLTQYCASFFVDQSLRNTLTKQKFSTDMKWRFKNGTYVGLQIGIYGSGHESGLVLFPGFAITSWPHP